MSYTQLDTSERFELYQNRTIDELTMDEVASKLNRSKSTISRELKRNSIQGRVYLPDTAQIKMQTRRQKSKQKFMSIRETSIDQIKQRLSLYHSPEQIAGRLQDEGIETISHETIYQMVYPNHQGLGEYQRYLR
jgi:transposase, IS30 family